MLSGVASGLSALSIRIGSSGRGYESSRQTLSKSSLHDAAGLVTSSTTRRLKLDGALAADFYRQVKIGPGSRIECPRGKSNAACIEPECANGLDSRLVSILDWSRFSTGLDSRLALILDWP